MKINILSAIALVISSLPLAAESVTTDTPAADAPVNDTAAIADVAPAPSAAAEALSVRYSCVFSTECVDDDCDATSYAGDLTIITDGAGLAEAEWADMSETVAMQAQIDDGVLLASSSAATDRKQRILTMVPDGAARFTTHLSDPLMAISYAGQCEKDG